MEIRLAAKLLWKNSFVKVTSRPAATCAAAPEKQFIRGLKFVLRTAPVFLCASLLAADARAERFSINAAISQAVLTNPGVGEASANRRATETELRQTQSTLLPQVRLEARVGPEKFTQDIKPPPAM
jgi:outer membrane protein TolC